MPYGTPRAQGVEQGKKEKEKTLETEIEREKEREREGIMKKATVRVSEMERGERERRRETREREGIVWPLHAQLPSSATLSLSRCILS